ncbi:alanine racemase [Psychrobacter sp. FDAARGOS_221]|uniref:alanine racemase n=1 Tax=Psychrobacter sp. FDAARGOS_221 TaxID=1975705 RepID=UPI000BB576F6|nr:alanine racemase [Psychrobacter sp. FDAARGOS_221]PNK59558.1 amino acid aldolase [Psychrobacter sp. FDAARGOS_221]
MDFSQINPPYSPSAWLDMDALDHNIALVTQQTQAVNLRLATKSIRSLDVLHYIKDNSPNYIGLMSYAADESVYLLENGFDNILCAYPTLDMQSVAQTLEYTRQGATMIWMVDRPEQVDALSQVAKSHQTTIEVCLDINMSMPLPKLYFGTKRSALMSKKDVKNLLKHIKKQRHIKVAALMGYEAQIAGLPEHLPGKTRLSPAIKMLKQRSKKQVSQRRGSLVKWLTKQGFDLKLVNGGGSGSMDFTSSQPEVTEITVGSAYYKPAYFDYMDSMSEYQPAAGFVLPVTRQPEKGVITCHSGGFIASGATGIDKAPVVHYPQGLSILTDEGFGEVQTPLAVNTKKLNNAAVPTIGSAVWFRHAKAGELCEHFNELVCYRDSQVIEAEGSARTMTTYRGEGKCFH